MSVIKQTGYMAGQKLEDDLIKKNGHPLLWSTPAALMADVERYYAVCIEKKEPFTISGFAAEVGVDRKFIINYSNRDGYFPAIKRCKVLAEAYMEKYLMSGRPPIGAIFVAKNNFGWKDEQTITHQNVSIGKVLLNLENQDVIDGQVIDPPALMDGVGS